jgi:hypothetical protein
MSASTLPILLRSLGLTTLARDYPDAITRAEADNWGYLRFLHQLTEGELNERLRRRIERMLKESRCPRDKTWPSSIRPSCPTRPVANCPVCSPAILFVAATIFSRSVCRAAARRCFAPPSAAS